MKKQLLVALLFAGAIAILPVGGMTQNWVVSATDNTNVSAGPTRPANAATLEDLKKKLAVSSGDEISSGNVDTVSANFAPVKAELDKLPKATVAQMLLSTDDSGKNTWAESVEAASLKIAGKNATTKAVSASGIDENAVSVVGVGLNKLTGNPALTINNVTEAEKPVVPAGYSNAKMLNISISGLATPEKLDYPVMITINVPAGMDKGRMVVLHYLNGGGYEVLQPYFNQAQTLMRFCTTSFSPFVIVQKEVVSQSDESRDPTWLELYENEISGAQKGATVRWKGVSAISNSIMKTLLARKDVTLVLDFTYEGKNYVITIPAGGALNNDVPWYGPLYLAAHYGNGTVPAAAVPAAPLAGGSAYVAKAGDTMSKIAKDNNMSLAQLASKNPQIQNIDLIRVGQTINLQ